MSWRGSPEIGAAREICKRFKKRAVIVLMIDEENLGYASYGETVAECKTAGVLAEVARAAVFKAMEDA
jgi:hypothetical protein